MNYLIIKFIHLLFLSFLLNLSSSYRSSGSEPENRDNLQSFQEKPGSITTCNTIESDTSTLSIDMKLEAYIQRGKLPGLTAIITKDGRRIYETAKGLVNIENKKRVGLDTRYRMASLTKPVVSVGVLQLIEKGQLKLSDKVSSYVPEINTLQLYDTQKKVGRKVTIHQLLTHTSGISSRFYTDETSRRYKGLKFDQETLDAFVEDILKIPVASDPGTAFRYGFSTDVLGLVIERVTGQSLSDYLEENVFKPLEMTQTSYELSGEVADYYVFGENNKLEFRKGSPAAFARGNSGLVSTVGDYTNFALMIMQGGNFKGKVVLNPETISLMSKNHLPADLTPIKIGELAFDGLGFGYGVSVTYEKNNLGFRPGSLCWIGSSHTYFFVDPINQVTGVLLSSLPDMANSPLIFEFNGMAYQALNELQIPIN